MTSDLQTPSSSRPRGHDFTQRPLSQAEARVLGTLAKLPIAVIVWIIFAVAVFRD